MCLTRPVVWVVEDDRGVARALQQWLSIHGTGCRVFHSANEALEALQAEALTADPSTPVRPCTLPIRAPDGTHCLLVGAVVDLNLVGQSGLSVLQALRARSDDLPLVLISALALAEQARYGPLPRGVVRLKKPFDLGALEAGLFGPQPLDQSGTASG
jgi:DNA-binding response OmpR family regulator